MFSGLASTPSIDDSTKKTSISLKDYLTLFNSEIIIDWDSFGGETVASFLEYVFDTWKSQIEVGLQNVFCDVCRINDILLDKEVYNFTGKENSLAYTLISNAINYYDIYCESVLDLATKTLTFIFKKASVNKVDIKLSDFGIYFIEKSFGDYNRASVYTKNYVKNQEWGLTEDNLIVKLPTDKKLIYPAKNKNFIAEESSENLTETEALNNAIYEAVMSLAENRYQENIDLNAQQYKSVIDLTNIDFSYKVDVYTDDGFYRTLPVGEIETDSKGNKHIIRLGHRVQEIIQEL
jgi:hypothetical protein